MCVVVIYSSYKSKIPYRVANALIIILGIGEYDANVMPSLEGINTDYINLIYTFNHVLKYSVLFLNNLNEIQYYKNKKIHLTPAIKNSFKKHWNYDEIENFYTNAVKYVVDNKHDSCIFAISSHGENDGIILDSTGDEVSLYGIFYQFNGQNCPYLIDKPKIFIIDACRGGMRSKPIKSKKNATKMVSTKNNGIDKNVAAELELKIEDQDLETNDDDINKQQAVRGNTNIIAGINQKKNLNKNEKSRVGKMNIISNKNKGMTSQADASKYYHQEANFRYIYGNPEGFAVFDGGIKGGYLIRATKKVFVNAKFIKQKRLNDIVDEIRNQVQKLAGKVSMENVQDINNMNFPVEFLKNTNQDT